MYNINFIRIKSYMRGNKAKCCKIAAIFLVFTVSFCIYLSGNFKNSDIEIIHALEEISIEAKIDVAPAKEEVFIIVDIQGAVNSPGVFSLPEGSRVNDAVLSAGGLTSNAYTRDVNLAAKLTDGDKVYIPEENEEIQAPAQMAGIVTNSLPGSSGSSGGGLVNINTATSEQLQTLSGVGPVTAQKIIEYREKNGGFKRIEDLMKVSGIGTKTFENLKDLITI